MIEAAATAMSDSAFGIWTSSILRPFCINARSTCSFFPNWSEIALGQSGTASSRFSMALACAQASIVLTLRIFV